MKRTGPLQREKQECLGDLSGFEWRRTCLVLKAKSESA